MPFGFNFQPRKIATFSGVNGSPVAPTATSPGNASHLIAQHNGLIDSLESQLSAYDAATAQDFSDLSADLQSQNGAIVDLQEQLAALGPPPTLPLAIQNIQLSTFSTEIDAYSQTYERISISLAGGDINFIVLDNDYSGVEQNIYLRLSGETTGKQVYFAFIKNGDAYLNLSFFNWFTMSDDWLSMSHGDVLFVHGIFVPGANNPHLIKLQSLIYVYQPS